MIKVAVVKQSNYPVKSAAIKNRLKSFLIKEGIVSDCEVSVALVGEKKMLDLSKKYLKDVYGRPDNSLHNVLSFTETEIKGSFVYPPDGKIYLGEIIICYPEAVEEAKKESVLIEERVCELVEHGAMHLLGKHHE